VAKQKRGPALVGPLNGVTCRGCWGYQLIVTEPLPVLLAVTEST
jgi:hypothetical protein